MVAALNKNGYLYAWYQSNLTLAWEDHVSTQTTITTAAFADNLLYVYSPSTLINGVEYNSSVRAINPLTGAYVWQVGLPKNFVGYSAPLWSNGMLFVGANTQLLVLNGASGTILKDFAWNLGGQIFSSPSIARSEVFVAAGSNLTALDLPLTVSAKAAAMASGDAEIFTASVQGGLPPYTYNWSFGDGSYSSAASPSHAYSGRGPYYVTVVVTDLAGSLSTIHLTPKLSPRFNIIFWENGLPIGTRWSVTVGSSSISAVNPIEFTLPNGNYSYTVGNIANYSRAPAGTFSVMGVGMTILEKFSLVRYTVTMKETGLSSGTNWSVTVGATTLSSTKSFINFPLANGTYAYTVANVANYSRTANGTFTVAGSSIMVTTHFTHVEYKVTLTESGLPAHTSWQVTIGLRMGSTTGTTISFSLPNGTYPFNASASGSGFGASPSTITVSGAAIGVVITFVSEGGTIPSWI